MKSLILLQLLLFSFLSYSQTEILSIPPLSSIEINNKKYNVRDLSVFGLKLKNKSLDEISVRIEDSVTSKFSSGFGLEPLGKMKIMVYKNEVVIFSNNTQKELKLKTSFFTPKKTVEMSTETNSISFTLKNSSLKSIPLIIPNVMNPNLSPKSNSSVNLKFGQEIFYKYKGRKRLLLRVNNNIQDGDVIDVKELIKEKVLEKK